MPKKINLIPPELAVNPKTTRVSRIIAAVSTVSLMLLILSVTGVIAAVLIFNYQLRKVNTDNERLKQEITSLQQSEQRLVLAKDRLDKIKKIQAGESAKDEIALFKEINASPIEDINYSEISLDSLKLESSVTTQTTEALTAFFDRLTNAKAVKTIMLQNLSYNPTSGFLASLIFEAQDYKNAEQ